MVKYNRISILLWMCTTEFSGHSCCLRIGWNTLLCQERLEWKWKWREKKLDCCVLTWVLIGCVRHNWGLYQSTSHLNNNVYLHVHCWKVQLMEGVWGLTPGHFLEVTREVHGWHCQWFSMPLITESMSGNLVECVDNKCYPMLTCMPSHNFFSTFLQEA